MTQRTIRILVLASMLTLVSACRPDPGASDYASQEDFAALPDADAGQDAGPEFLDGPDPWRPGDPRLSLGVFYEGGASQAVPIDDESTHLYVYEETVALAPDLERIEGTRSHVAVLTGKPWWGFGIHWDTPGDFTTWSTLHLSLKGVGTGFEQVQIGMHDAPTINLLASDYGYGADGEWYTLAIPLTDFAGGGLDLSAVGAPFVLSGSGGTAGDALYVDAVYFTTQP